MLGKCICANELWGEIGRNKEVILRSYFHIYLINLTGKHASVPICFINKLRYEQL